VTAPEVLNAGMSSGHDICGPVSFEASHRAESGFEAPMVGFDSVVGVLGRVVKCSREELCNDSDQGRGPGRW
jgi:hypothetical protein